MLGLMLHKWLNRRLWSCAALLVCLMHAVSARNSVDNVCIHKATWSHKWFIICGCTLHSTVILSTWVQCMPVSALFVWPHAVYLKSQVILNTSDLPTVPSVTCVGKPPEVKLHVSLKHKSYALWVTHIALPCSTPPQSYNFYVTNNKS